MTTHRGGEEMSNDLVKRLRESCHGYPAAEIQWPHRILHEAADAIEALEARVAELEAQVNSWRDAFESDDRDTRYFGKMLKAQSSQQAKLAEAAKVRETFCLAIPGSDEEFHAWVVGFDCAVAIFKGDGK